MKILSAFLLISTLGVSLTSHSAPNERALAVSKYWTAERIAAAQPRDFVLDHRGLAYLKSKGGQLKPYGHNVPASPEPRAKGGKGGGKPGGGSDGGGNTDSTVFSDVSNAEWTAGGHVQTAAGRIFFVMQGGGYVCSGTLVNDGETASDKSIILTAAHCVYDDVNKAFAEAAIFIPNQTATTGTGTDGDCSNDDMGCWVVDYGVVSAGWHNRTFPENIPWDYGFYAVGTSQQSSETRFINEGSTTALDNATTPMEIAFSSAVDGDYTRALGYSYRNDPNFMYCGEPVTGSSYGGYLLSSCGLSGGASGGPWSQSQEVDLGTGPIISVNSYGPARGKSYMGGPSLFNNDAECLFNTIKANTFDNTVNGEGVISCAGYAQ